ncbi:MarR family transcriptional regulator [Spiractinospora alimapuensis]|uniref:GbsR/MarR family transcriptional regulator n=1 Tax=Spiractinospora alimapuensis TaxID=2820884 RepID=UPI001F25A36C|nr:MarR family transcriptional regulator [Spiractinospora alimapuensis]QVQ54162.1 MarR family transcriptional regulator [Spiractinospora alimapuensis]
MALTDPHPQDIRRFTERFATMLTQAGMARMPARVFAALLASQTGELTAREIRAELSISPGSVSKAVRYLEAFGLLHRTRVGGRDIYRFSGDWVETFTRREALFAPWEDGALRGAELFGPDTVRGARFMDLAYFMRMVRGTITHARERWRRTVSE